MLDGPRVRRHLPAMSRALQAIILVGAMLAIVAQGGAPSWKPAYYVLKPLTTIAVIALAATTRDPLSARYRALMVCGLICALVGDILLMLPRDLFIAGLAAFLVAHLCFIGALWSQSRFAERPVAFAGYAIVAIALLSVLLPVLPPPLKVPVLLYCVVILTMASQGASWMLSTGIAPARLAALGGAWFVASDATLAIDRFRADVPFRDLLVMGTYWIAIWLLARSVSRAPGAA